MAEFWLPWVDVVVALVVVWEAVAFTLAEWLALLVVDDGAAKALLQGRQISRM